MNGILLQGLCTKDVGVQYVQKKNPNKKRKEAAEQEFLKMLQTLKYSLLSNYENNTKQVQIKCNNKQTFNITPKYFKRLVNQKIEPFRKCRKKKV
ncbi:MAG: hypothetical protein KGD68_14665 [Candidatus Lokiarchaeota archaeon]|nr:hypothetical protein [Candidatus Lokiarchaeota archaeon]